MNTIKNLKLSLIAVLVLFSINSCVNDDDWSLPPVHCADNWATNMTLEELFSTIDATGQITTFEEEKIIEGYVVSSDSTGNFFKTVSIQNSLNNPTHGVQVEMDRTNLFNNFPLGSKIKVNLKGLDVGYDRGVLKVGQTYEDAGGNIRVGRMNEFKINNHVVRSCDMIEYATPVEFNNIAEVFASGVINTLVTIHNVQFADSQLGLNYAESNQTVDRILEDNLGNTIKLRNSNFASFADEQLPEGSGSITVVLSVYASGNITPSTYQLYIRDTKDVKFNQPRFGDSGTDPQPGDYEFFDCLNENFESYSTNNENFTKYENLALTGNRKWRITEFNGNKYIQATAFNANSNMTAYFVVPVDFTNADYFSFRSNDGHYNGDPLKVYYSTNYTPGGNIDNATLVDITSSFNIASGTTNNYGNFVDSGEYDLSGLSGNGVIVFAYTGSPNGITTTIQIDDIKIINNDNPNCEFDSGGDDPTPPSDGAAPLFVGHDFENWNDFLGGLNSFGIKPYANQSQGTGIDGSASLHISGIPTGNDYVFTTIAPEGLPPTYSKVSFYMKGTSEKSVSLNLYVDDSNYYKFNLGNITSSAVIQNAGNNQYSGTINTNGEWVLIELDLSNINDLNVNNTSGNLFALKVGNSANYDLHFDNFVIE